MFGWLRNRQSPKVAAERIYEGIVDQARQPPFYSRFGIPDTLEGRYEMVALHLFLVHERLHAEAPLHNDLARALTERFVTDMDDCMREIGIGDMSVPKKVKRAAAGLLERVHDYRAALAQSSDDGLLAAIDHHAFSSKRPEDNPLPHGQQASAAALAGYVRASLARLAPMQVEDIVRDGPRFAPIPDVSG